MHRKLNLFTIVLFVLFTSNLSSLDLVIDGNLDEADWLNAREITKYYESLPYTLNDASGSQKVLVLEDEKGIYLGFISYQANETIRAQKHQRDDEMANADMVGVSIDFDGDGLTEAQEEDIYGTSDLLSDSDEDGLSDGYEVNTSFTDPNDSE